MFAKFDEIPSMILEVIKETKRYGHTFGRSDNVKTVVTAQTGYSHTSSGRMDFGKYAVFLFLQTLTHL